MTGKVNVMKKLVIYFIYERNFFDCQLNVKLLLAVLMRLDLQLLLSVDDDYPIL